MTHRWYWVLKVWLVLLVTYLFYSLLSNWIRNSHMYLFATILGGVDLELLFQILDILKLGFNILFSSCFVSYGKTNTQTKTKISPEMVLRIPNSVFKTTLQPVTDISFCYVIITGNSFFWWIAVLVFLKLWFMKFLIHRTVCIKSSIDFFYVKIWRVPSRLLNKNFCSGILKSHF